MEQQQISVKKLKAMEKVKRANADLAKIEVLNHNKRDHERMLENESHKRTG